MITFFKHLFFSRCYHGGKRHKFKPVYKTKRTGGDSFTLANLDQEYFCSVCEWCGVHHAKMNPLEDTGPTSKNTVQEKLIDMHRESIRSGFMKPFIVDEQPLITIRDEEKNETT